MAGVERAAYNWGVTDAFAVRAGVNGRAEIAVIAGRAVQRLLEEDTPLRLFDAAIHRTWIAVITR